MRIKVWYIFKNKFEWFLPSKDVFWSWIEFLPKYRIVKSAACNMHINIVLHTFTKIACCKKIILNIFAWSIAYYFMLKIPIKRFIEWIAKIFIKPIFGAHMNFFWVFQLSLNVIIQTVKNKKPSLLVNNKKNYYNHQNNLQYFLTIDYYGSLFTVFFSLYSLDFIWNSLFKSKSRRPLLQ